MITVRLSPGLLALAQPHFAQTGDEPVVIWVTGYGPSDTKFVMP